MAPVLPDYTQARQKKYMDEALNSSADYGAQGFHWFELTSSEYDDPDNVNTYSGLITSSGQDKPALSAYDETDNNLRQGTPVALANKYTTETIGGYLSVDNVYNGLPSGASLNLSQNGTYTVRTNDQWLPRTGPADVVTHHDWNDDENEYKLSHVFQSEDFGGQESAKFKYTYTINFATNLTGSFDPSKKIEIRDPWYVDATNNQIDDFFSLIETTDTTFYYAFLDQGDINNLVPPYYSLRSPWVGQLSDSEYVAFHDWQATGAQLGTDPDYPNNDNVKAVVFESPNATIEVIYTRVLVNGGTLNHNYGDFWVRAPKFLASTDNIYQFNSWQTTDATCTYPNASNTVVQFLSENATLVATYESIPTSQNNYTFNLNSDLTIPSGAHYRFAPGFKWNIVGGVNLTLDGTPDDPIILECHAEYLGKGTDYKWAGLRIIRGVLDIQHTVILEADTAIYIEQQYNVNHDIQVSIQNCTFVNNNAGILIDEHPYYFGAISSDIQNNIFSQHNIGISLNVFNNFSYSLSYNWLHQCDYSYLSCYLDNVDCNNNDEDAPDPLFIDPANGDFHLSASSLYIDSGDPNTPQDPDGTIADIGAYYYPHY